MLRRSFIQRLVLAIASLKGLRIMAAPKTKKKLKMINTPTEQHWVGDGFNVHSLIHPHQGTYEYTSPFLLLDYAPEKHFEPTTQKLGVGEHPHRGFETVTFAINGEVEHRDSSGGGGVIKTGGVQWMTAARGLVHEEFHSREFAKQGGLFEMVQLWVNLPAKHKMESPRYQGLNVEDFPVKDLQGAKVKVIAGSYEKHRGPSKTFTPINLYEVDFEKDQNLNFDFESGTNTMVLVLKGDVTIEGNQLNKTSLAIYEREGETIEVSAKKGSKLLILNGEPIDEPVASHGPFVMNTQEELVQAFQDFQSGKMGRLN